MRSEKWQQALVHLFLKLSDNNVKLQSSAPVNDREPWFVAREQEIFDTAFSVIFNGTGTFPNLPESDACAALSALDRVLFDRFSNTVLGETVKLDECEFWLIPRLFRHGMLSSHQQQVDSVRRFMRHFYIAPETVKAFSCPTINVIIREADEELNERLTARAIPDIMRILVTQFQDGVTPDWRNENGRLLTDGLTDHETRWTSVRAFVDLAVAEGVEIMVFPELTLPKSMRGDLEKMLASLASDSSHLLLVAGGSYYEATASGLKSVTELLDWRGVCVLRHEKIRHLTCKDEQATEGFVPGTRIELLATALGIFAIPICLDYSDEADGFCRIWQTLGVDWALVPSMGDAPTVSAHFRQSATLHRAFGTVTLVANQPRALPGKRESESFVYPTVSGQNGQNMPISLKLDYSVRRN